jgi:hypothetical protein
MSVIEKKHMCRHYIHPHIIAQDILRGICVDIM